MSELLQEFKDFYDGQDLHIVRNNEELVLNNYFNISPTYAVSFPNNSYTQENISITNQGGIFSIKAGVFNGTKTISNIKIKVSEGDTSIHIIIHIHDSISAVWLSPSPMTIYKNHGNIRLGLFAKFNDGIIANLSWYQNLIWANDSLPSYLGINTQTGLISITGTFPSSLPPNYSDTDYRVKVILPPLLQSSSGPLEALGYIKISLHHGVLEFQKGKGNISNPLNMQVIILSDGFLENEEALFDNYINQVVDTEDSPWKHINRVNF